MSHPSAFLPSRDLPRHVKSTPLPQLEEALTNLQKAYALDHTREEWIGEPAAESAPPDDAFETQCVRTWLHALIHYGCQYLEASALVDPAAALLVHLAGQAAGGSRTCVYRFFLGTEAPTDANQAEASVSIRDVALVEDALGARTWGAAPYLARRLMQQYAHASSVPAKTLELGAGTGLVGLAWAQWLSTRTPPPNVNVTLTDHHATVLANLQFNAQATSIPWVHVRHLDWQAVYNAHHGPLQYHTTAQTVPDDNEQRTRIYGNVPSDVRYDMIIAADCIYDPWHARWIASVAEQHLARPTPGTVQPQLHLLMPIRSTHTAELQSVYDVFSAPHPLRIVLEQSLDGTDNFGPADRIRATTTTRTGTLVAYRHMIIEWA